MKQILKNKSMKIFTSFILVFSMLALSSATAQDNKKSGDMEKVQDENMDYMKQIYRIVKDYPQFSYSYTFDDGEVEDVVVTGVEDEIDRKRLEVMLFDLKSNKNRIKNKPNRVGVFYSVDKAAEYKNGRDALEEKILSNLKYPEDAKNWGVEGTIFVKFVVDEDGEIPFATTSTDIETSMEVYLNELEEQAIEAVKATSGNWEPAEVDNVDVSSLAVVPVTFDFEKNPALPALIR